MNAIVMTMVYNEGAMLRRWLRHYGSHLGPQNLLVIDHASNDGSTADIGASGRLRLPRDAGFDDGLRADFVGDLQASLLRYYDVVIYTDCDEFLIPDPRRFDSLSQYLARNSESCTRPLGFDIFHEREAEAPFDTDAPALMQRRYCRFHSQLCKPLVARTPVRWAPGFHTSDNPAKVDPRLFLIHLKYVDHGAAMQRAAVTRAMKWPERAIEKGWSRRHRASDEELTDRFFDAPSAILARDGVSNLDPIALADLVNRSLIQTHGVWVCPPIGGDVFFHIPEWLKPTL